MYNITNAAKLIQCFLFSVVATILFGFVSIAEEQSFTEEANTPSSLSKQYSAELETVISEYTKILEDGGWPSLQVGKTIKIGDSDERIPTVKKILSIMGDYKPSSENESNILDEELAEAITSFQERHGLKNDGVLGKKTQLALAVPVEFRIAQMRSTIERMKEMPDLGEKYILVNIPGFYLKAIDDNNIALTSRIIVGTPKNATPLFSQPITDISFNPAWHVPPSIARNEMMGKLRNNPEYFTKSNFVVTDSNGDKVDVTEIDWENEKDSSYKFVQRAGKGNALGKVKFNLPDTNNIYLHSTANPKLFDEAERSLSHGCIRVEMAKELAFFVMNGASEWSQDKIDELYESNRSKILPVEHVQVYLAYWTSWVDETTKKPHFYTDIYGRDKKRVNEIIAEIKNPDGNNIKVAMQ